MGKTMRFMPNDPDVRRCRKISRIGLQCTKPKSHTSAELDVVHKAGMFVWRDEPFYINRSDGGPSKEEGVSTQSGYPSRGATGDVGSDGDTRDWPSPQTAQEARNQMRRDFPFHSPDSPYEVLASWWIDQANVEIERTVPKAIEYSATDLTDIGHDLARTAGREVSDEEAAELGVFFYLRGKMARWVGAVIAGERVSDDTLFDIGVYVRMAQRIREFGSWPGTEEPDETGR